MAQTFVGLVNGLKKLIEAITTSAGVGDSGKIPALDSSGKLDSTFMPAGIAAETRALTASETISAGDFVNIWDDTGTLKVRKADASGGYGKKADGFVLAAVTSGNTATIYPLGDINSQVSGLTPGADYWLSSTAGTLATTAPSTSAHIIQYIGKATTATELLTECQEAIEIG